MTLRVAGVDDRSRLPGALVEIHVGGGVSGDDAPDNAWVDGEGNYWVDGEGNYWVHEG